MTYLKYLLKILFLFSSTLLWAQMDKADKLFEDYKYAQAIEIYKPIADKGNIRAVRKIAECYRKINDYDNAEKYFAIVVADKNAIPKSNLYFGQILMANEKYDEAKKWLQKYLNLKSDADTTFARTLLISCEKAKTDLSIDRKIIVENFKSINTNSSDFCAIPYKNGILFTSTREGKINGASGNAFQQVYLATCAKDSSWQIESLKGVVNSKNYNSGPASIDSLRDMIYFTKNNFQLGEAVTNKKGDVTLKIFSARKVNDHWKDIKELEFNDKEYSCAFPSINAQGNMIFFTSDRAGGFGGKDIYYSTLTNGTWSKPKNAGNKINTKGDERYPFIHSDGTLYFSSTGLPGFGSMDIFKSVPNKLGEFGNPENLGKPFNSPTDDFGFYIDANQSHGYFSSDRNGGMGNDDIYKFEYLDVPLTLKLYCDGKAADDLEITIKKDGEITKTGIYSKQLTIILNTNAHYEISCSKVGFKTQIFQLNVSKHQKPIFKTISLEQPN